MRAQTLTYSFIVGISTFLFLSLLVYAGLFRGIDATLTDRLFSTRDIHSDIVIVEIDSESLAQLGQWPFPRETIATGLRHIIAAQPKTIGIDILFADPSRLGEDDDRALSQVLKESNVPIVLPVQATRLLLHENEFPEAETLVRTNVIFREGEHVLEGHINVIQDRDGVVRRVPHTITDAEGTLLKSFASILYPNTRTNTEPVVYAGIPGSIRHVSFADVFAGNVDPSVFTDAYVLMGATAPDLHDTVATPVSGGLAMPGVEVHGHILNMLLLGYSLTEISSTTLLFILFVLILIPILAFAYIRTISFALIATLVLILGTVFFGVVCFEMGYLVSIVYMALAVFVSGGLSLLVRYVLLERERREIKGVFSKYVSKAVLEELLKNPQAVKLGGVEAPVTIFFSDIRGFTTLSEKLSPTGLTSFLNRYLTAMTDIVLQNGGVVDKYIGDAIMAFWGAPLTSLTHAHDAVRSSLAMLKALDAFNEASAKRSEPPINIGIGLNTGVVVVGNMGSRERFDYTIMGDAVNLGSRIEGQTKTYGVRLLASEMTIAELQRQKVREQYVIREVDRVTVKGKTEPVALFEIVEEKSIPHVQKILSSFTLLRDAYYAGNWKEAIRYGENILQEGSDGPTEVLLGRSRLFLLNPPQSWSGVYELTSK